MWLLLLACIQPEPPKDTGLPCETSTWYADRDTDGFGDVLSSQLSCAQPPGFVADATDCNDGDSATFPGAFEICDGVDNNCNGTIDESSSIDAGIWYADGDGDGFGDGSWSQTSCTQPPGFVADATDCNDGDPSIYLFAWDDPADGVDQNCDGLDGFTDDVVCDGFTTPAEAFALFRAGPDLLDTSAVESRIATCTVTDTEVTRVRDYIIVIGDSDPCYDEGTAVGASTVSCTEASDGIYATGSGDSFDRRGSSSNWGSYGDYLWGDSTASLSFYAETPQGGSLDPHRLRYSSSESRDNYHNQFLDVSNDSSESVVEVDAILQSGASRSYRYEDSHSVHWPWGGIQIFTDNSWTYESESCTLSFTRQIVDEYLFTGDYTYYAAGSDGEHELVVQTSPDLVVCGYNFQALMGDYRYELVWATLDGVGTVVQLSDWVAAPGDSDGDGWPADFGDCDDQDPSTNPCGTDDGQDRNCDGLVQ